MCSGGMSDNGTRRGRGMVWKWMDGRIVKEDPLRSGIHSMVPWIFCTTERSHEGASVSRIRGEGSHGSCAVGFESRTKDVERGEVGSLELDQVNGRSNYGFIGGTANRLADVWEGKV